MPADYQLWIDGAPANAASGEIFETLDPSTGQAHATVARAGAPDADQALRFGLVNRVWPADDLRREAEAAVAALAAGPTLAFGRTKALFRDHLGTGLAGALAGEAEAQVASGQTKDHLEGVTAFLEKRPPNFQGA